MWEACYFLDVSSLEFLLEERSEGGKHTEGRKPSEEQVTLQELEALLDGERLSKYQGTKNRRVAGTCLGAGLLLRLAATEFNYNRCLLQDKQDCSERALWNSRMLTPRDIMERLRRLPAECQIELRYRYGKDGKPYWDGIPLFFSLSHSGDLVALAVSEQEIGLDVQEMTGADWKKLAKRFFADEEQEELWRLCEPSEESGQREFFRLWSRKESYGKLTGEGVLPYLQKRVTELENVAFFEKKLELRDKEYFFALCKGRGNGREK